MSALWHAWASLLTWLPAPWQAGLALVLALLLVTKLAPRLIRSCGWTLQTGWMPLLELLTYPEYLLTSVFRRYSWQPLPGTYTYGRTLGALAPPGTRLGQWLRGRFQRKLRFPWKTTVLVIAVLASCWYAAPRVPPGAAKTLVANVNTDDTHLSTWLSTGQWTPAATPLPACRSVAPAKHPSSKKKVRGKTKHR